MEIRDPNTGQIKTWVWAAGALGFVVVLFVFTKVAGSGQSTSAGTIPASGQSSDITDMLSALMDAIKKIDASNPPPTSNPPPPPPDPHKHDVKEYKVKAGESWNDVAAKFGMTLHQLYKLNPILQSLGHPDLNRVGGRTIKVWDVAGTNDPAPTTFKLTKTLDTWREVASKSGLTLPQFFALNPSLNTRREKRPDVERKAGRTVNIGATQ